MKRRFTPWGKEVKKKLLDMNLTQKEFCKRHEIPYNRFTEMVTGLNEEWHNGRMINKKNWKYRQIVNKVLKIKTTA